MSSRYFTNKYVDSTLDISEQNQSELLQYAYSILSECIKKLPPTEANHDGGLYVGFVGISYALLHLLKSPFYDDNLRSQMLNEARYLVEQDLYYFGKMEKAKDDMVLSFLLGHAGTLSVAGCIYDRLGMKSEASKYVNEFLSLATKFTPIKIYNFGSDELFVGKAGYLAGLCLLKTFCKETPVHLPNDTLYRILDSIVNSGQRYAQRHNSKCPLMFGYYNTEYLGAGHGLAGILLMIMKFRDYLSERPTIVAIIQQSLNYMLSITPPSGNLPPATDDIGRRTSPDTELVHWCHGAAGAVYAYARAYELWPNAKYKEAAVVCGEVVWKYGLLKKGPGICHGIAGSGYVFLVLYRLLNDSKYLHRAKCFLDFLNTDEFKTRARVPDSPYSLFEGWAGTACFVADLAEPSTGFFPFFDVFDS